MAPTELSTLERLWRVWRRLIDESIAKHLRNLPTSAIEVADYIARGGKRFRGFLVMLVAQELGACVSSALDAAVAVELVHAASLALDDIIDADTVRRGKPAAWIAYGVSKTVVVSNLLVPYAQKLILERYGERALAKTVDTWLAISEGEVLDAFERYDMEPPQPSTYEQVLKLKTGSLFKLAAELGAIAAQRLDVMEQLGSFGEELGIAYQIADDITDAVKGKKEPGLKLFLAWSRGHLEKALQELVRRVRRASELARRVLGPRTLLAHVPPFMVKVMLSEAGTDFVKTVEPALRGAVE